MILIIDSGCNRQRYMSSIKRIVICLIEYPDSRYQQNRENMPTEFFKYQSKSRPVLLNCHPLLCKGNCTAHMIVIIAIIENLYDAKPLIWCDLTSRKTRMAVHFDRKVLYERRAHHAMSNGRLGVLSANRALWGNQVPRDAPIRSRMRDCLTTGLSLTSRVSDLMSCLMFSQNAESQLMYTTIVPQGLH